MKNVIAISRTVPDWYKGLRYEKLAPSWNMLRMEGEEYEKKFKEILETLDPREVYEELKMMVGGAEPILVCWEPPFEPCHRRLVAEWFEKKLGIKVPELGYERYYPTYAELRVRKERQLKQAKLFG